MQNMILDLSNWMIAFYDKEAQFIYHKLILKMISDNKSTVPEIFSNRALNIPTSKLLFG